MQKNLVKFGLEILGLVIVGGAVWYGVLLYQRKNSPEYAQELEYKKLLEAYKNDTYGGDTPEETLRLFIDALKAGDTDLAAKYFVLDEQEEWKIKLSDIQKRSVLTFMIDDLEKLKVTKQDSDRAFFTLADEKKVVLVEMILAKNEKNKWKIIEL